MDWHYTWLVIYLMASYLMTQTLISIYPQLQSLIANPTSLDNTSIPRLKRNLTWNRVSLPLDFVVGVLVLQKEIFTCNAHFVKSIQIWKYSRSYFSAFGLKKDRYCISLRIQSKYGKIHSRITPNTDTFYAVANVSPVIYVNRAREINSAIKNAKASP